MKRQVYLILDSISGKYYSRHENFTNFIPDIVQMLHEKGAEDKKNILQIQFPKTKLEIKSLTINV